MEVLVTAFDRMHGMWRAAVDSAGPVLAQLRRILPTVVCVAALATMAIGIFRTRAFNDDGMIHLRVVQQVRSGNGLVYNLGERVEVSSSPLWVLTLAVADFLLPMRLESITLLLSGVLAVTGVALVMRAGFNDATARHAQAWPALVLLFAIHPAVWRWSTTGMEDGLVIAWIGACWYLARRSRRQRSLDAVYALAIGIGPLIRQDYVIACGLMLLAALWSERRAATRKSALIFAAVAISPALLYQLFRMAYFGLLVPNPTLAKNLGDPRWRRGWYWLTSSINVEWPSFSLWVLAAIIFAAIALTARGDRLTALAFTAAGAAMVLPALAAGGDFMNVRLLVPAVFAFTISAAMVVVPSVTALDAAITAQDRTRRPAPAWYRNPRVARYAARLQPLAVGLVVVLTVVLPISRIITNEQFWKPRSEPFMTATARRVADVAGLIDLDRGRSVDDNPVAYLSLLRQENIGMPQQTYVSVGIGAIAAYRPVQDRIYDQLGLANPIGSHMMPAPSGYGLPGHEKPIPAAWVLADLGLPATPEVATLIPVALPRALSMVPETPLASVAEDTLAAKHALACGELAEIRSAVSDPLTLGRAWKNLMGAWSRTWVTFDPDPHVAERAVCGNKN